jgi:hypothetical protein
MFAKKRNKTQVQMRFLLDLQQLRKLSDRQSEELLATRNSEVMLQKEMDTPWSIYRDFTA